MDGFDDGGRFHDDDPGVVAALDQMLAQTRDELRTAKDVAVTYVRASDNAFIYWTHVEGEREEVLAFLMASLLRVWRSCERAGLAREEIASLVGRGLEELLDS